MRRLFWVSVGAVAGVAGYRRATALVRSLRPAPRAGSLTGFATDVREGMALYMERQAARTPPALEDHARRGIGPGERGTGPGEHGASRETAPDPRRPATPRWLARRAASSRTDRTDELKDGR